jgi:hypothetical protein
VVLQNTAIWRSKFIEQFEELLHTYPPMKMEHSVPKRRHIKFRRRGITQKKAYNKSKYLVQWRVTSIAERVVLLGVSVRLSNTVTACYRHSQRCRWGHRDSGMWHGFIGWPVSDVLRRRHGLIFTGRNDRELKPMAQWRDVTWRQNGDVRQIVTSNSYIRTPFTCSYIILHSYAMKAYKVSTGKAPLILNLANRWRWVVNSGPRPPYPR